MLTKKLIRNKMITCLIGCLARDGHMVQYLFDMHKVILSLSLSIWK